MRLYLSSFKIGNYPDRLVSLIGSGKRVGLIVNALDNGSKGRTEWLATQTEALNNLGFITEEIDLRNYFGRENDLKNALSRFDGLWINGGNAFLLRRAMRQSGFDSTIKELLQADKIAYAGFSAAVCCASPTLRGAELVDDANAISEKYKSEIIWDGLGLIDYNVIVYCQSDHSESDDAEKELQYLKDNNIPYKTLRDGQVIIVDGEKTEMLE